MSGRSHPRSPTPSCVRVEANHARRSDGRHSNSGDRPACWRVMSPVVGVWHIGRRRDRRMCRVVRAVEVLLYAFDRAATRARDRGADALADVAAQGVYRGSVAVNAPGVPVSTVECRTNGSRCRRTTAPSSTRRRSCRPSRAVRSRSATRRTTRFSACAVRGTAPRAATACPRPRCGAAESGQAGRQTGDVSDDGDCPARLSRGDHL